ncbi:MAG TPA: hypothetical protein VN577_19965 [Terriglobales bacterium]|nr:hypothetical protein [Terriglobales bacterium]
MAASVTIELIGDERDAVRSANNIEGQIKKVGTQGNVVFTDMARSQRTANAEGERLGRTIGGLARQTSTLGPIVETAFSAGPLIAFGLLVLTQTDRIKALAQELGGYNEKMREMDRLNRQANVKAFVELGLPSAIEQNARINALNIEKEKIDENERARVGGMMDQMDLIQRTTVALYQRLRVEKEITNETDLRNEALKHAREDAEEEAKRRKAYAAGAFPLPDYSNETARNQSRAEMNAQINQVGKTGLVLLQQQEQDEIAKLRAQGLQDAVLVAEREYQTHQLYAAKRIQLMEQIQEKARAMAAQSAEVVAEGSNEISKRVDQELNAQLKAEEQAGERRQVLLESELDANVQLQADRRRLAGDAVGAMIIEEMHRVDVTIAGLKSIGIQEEELGRLRQTMQESVNARVAEEHRRMVERLGRDMEDVFDDITSGNIGKRILSNIKRLFFQIVAEWILSMNKMRSATSGSGGGGGGWLGTITGAIGSIIFGRGSVLGGGGSAGSRVPGVTPIGTSIGSTNGVGGGGIGSTAGIPGTGVFSSGSSTSGGGGYFGGPMFSFASSGGGFGDALPRTSGSQSGGGIGDILRTTLPGGKSGVPVSRSAQLMGMLVTGGAALAGKVGGTPAMLGAMLGIGGLAALYGSSTAAMMAVAPFAPYLGPAAGGLVGFGVGMQHGKAAGSLSGAGSGALVGLLAGGPIGAVIGGIVGLFSGLFGGIFGGSKRRRQAERFATEQKSELQKLLEAYNTYQIDSGSALQQLDAVRTNSWSELSKLKGEGKDVFRRTLEPEINRISSLIRETQTERDRRASLFFGPPMFATGGELAGSRIAGWRLTGGRVLMIGHEGERMMNREASQKYGSLLDSLNEGRRPAGSFGGDSFVFNTLDAATISYWLRNGGSQEIRSAIGRDRREGR